VYQLYDSDYEEQQEEKELANKLFSSVYKKTNVPKIQMFDDDEVEEPPIEKISQPTSIVSTPSAVTSRGKIQESLNVDDEIDIYLAKLDDLYDL
jgi:hypothetical protein